MCAKVNRKKQRNDEGGEQKSVTLLQIAEWRSENEKHWGDDGRVGGR